MVLTQRLQYSDYQVVLDLETASSGDKLLLRGPVIQTFIVGSCHGRSVDVNEFFRQD